VDASIRTLVPLESVAKGVEGDGKMTRAAQGCELTIGWWIDEPTDNRVAGCEENISEGTPLYISPAVRKQTLTFLSNFLISRYKEKPFSSQIQLLFFIIVTTLFIYNTVISVTIRSR
jgi:hypothetical protein